MQRAGGGTGFVLEGAEKITLCFRSAAITAGRWGQGPGSQPGQEGMGRGGAQAGLPQGAKLGGCSGS